MNAVLRASSGLLAAAAMLPVLAGCGGTNGSQGQTVTQPGGCTSHYEPVVATASQRALKRLLLHGVDPKVKALRVVPHKPADGKSTINLLDKHRKLVRSLDMWRKKDGTWVAQQWKQCTD